MTGSRFNSTVIEYLAVQPAKLLATGDAAAFLSVRLDPSDSFLVTNFALTQKQALRLRNDLDALLRDPDSWLFTPDAKTDEFL